MSGSHRDPWGEMLGLREAMDNLLEEHVGRHRAPGAGIVLGLAVDLREEATVYVLTASVPGVTAAEVSIAILGDTVRISGERREQRPTEERQTGERWLIRERHFGPFDRTVKLPAAIATAEVVASIADGVLTVTLPKAAPAGARTIAVRPGGATERAIEIEGSGGVADE